MSTTTNYPHLTIDDDGTARIENTRYKVIHLAGEHFHYGWSAEEVLRQHPDLRPEQVYAALTYFYDHYESLIEQMREKGFDFGPGDFDHDEWLPVHTLTRPSMPRQPLA